MAAEGVRFTLGQGNVSEEVYAAFHDEPLTVVFPAVIEARLLQVDAETKYLPLHHLDAVQVEGMLAENGGSWTLAVEKDATTGVLDGELLREVYDKGGGVVELPLRSPTPAEHLVLADSAELYGPYASWTRIKDAVNYPVAQVTLVATAAGLFGLLALEKDIDRLWAMKAATLVAAIAAVFSTYWGEWQTTEEVRPARLDLVRARQTKMFKDAIQRTRAGLILLFVAVGLAIVATWPTGGSAQSASIGSPTVRAGMRGTKLVSLTVSWSGLETGVVDVSSTLTGSMRATVTAKAAGDDGVEQPLQTTVPRSEKSVRVETHAVDARGEQVGVGYTVLVKLPAGG